MRSPKKNMRNKILARLEGSGLGEYTMEVRTAKDGHLNGFFLLFSLYYKKIQSLNRLNTEQVEQAEYRSLNKAKNGIVSSHTSSSPGSGFNSC